jgi:hypothetical protein
MAKKLTTAGGAPVVDNQNIMTAGPRGLALLQDVWLLEKLAHFDREVIPERRMHAKGSGAYGTFTVTNDITKYTRAKFLSQVGKKTELFARFTTVAGERGAADAERDIRGFAVSSIPRKVTGIWSATTRRYSSCATRSSSPTSTTRSSATPRPTCAVRRTTGTSGPCYPRRCTR